jgi:Domain of Unknown Function (DUF1080)
MQAHHMRTLHVTCAAALCVVAAAARWASAQTDGAGAPNELTATEQHAGWRLLFDGRTLTGWHALGYASMPPGLWTVADGIIEHLPKRKGAVQADGQPMQGFDLVSDSSYEDFELSWEWKISEAGNSGVKYNVSEQLSTSFAPPHAAKGWEYQIIDDARNEDNKLATHRTGALYDMFAPNEFKRVKPAGQWNRSRLLFRGNHGEHWLNGIRVVSFDLGTPAFDSAFAKSKYAQYPPWFPLRRKGQIVLQDHDSVVWFRDIKIRVLK